ncbi:MAG: FAD-dependent thymidylate synthase [Candidatus Eisenbacteria bacterium]|uniref:Flavin-dependent thymidylate synthase n=1 Tax=Eiseniibacteriota bacterium TaxID=2212470 RepID=A0A956SGQ4_UNCEI|nr:FAD-dependent thymidylate synthase [Candidatus Eisenbacteria bacterium]MCB9462403.1 FAD-dependent thymidylate synthase [Candidatus Eisenbacteria bacterium]
MTRPVSPELDEILGQRFPVLDDGFVRVVDYMGADESIVQAARVSYGRGTKKVHEDRGLIRYLLRHRHTTPLEMCEIKFHVRVPMDCWRQWIRHRTANVNEYSTRYSEAIDASQRTTPDAWRVQSTGNRQGSAGTLPEDVGQTLSDEEARFQDDARRIYESRLEAGVAREQARKDLPLSTYTEAYWKVDLHNLLHFLALRMDSHAQEEIRAYATVIGEEIVRRWCPLVWEAFIDYRMESLGLTRLDISILEALHGAGPDAARVRADELGWLEVGTSGRFKRNRERAECEAKLERLGLPIPWAE